MTCTRCGIESATLDDGLHLCVTMNADVNLLTLQPSPYVAAWTFDCTTWWHANTCPNAFHRFMQKHLLGITWRKP